MSKNTPNLFLILAALVFVGGLGALVMASRSTPPPAPVVVADDPVEKARGISERMQEAMGAKDGQGDLAQLLPDAVQLAQKYPQCFEAQLLLGQLYIAQKRYDLAYEPTHAALQLRPLGQALTQLLGTLAANTNRPGQAEALYLNALEKAVGKREKGLVHAMLGSIYRAQGKLDQADKQYGLAVQDDPFLVAAHVARTDLALAGNKIDEALKREEEGEAWNASDPKADQSPFVILKARILLAKGQPEEAYRLMLTGVSFEQRLTLPAAAALAQIWDKQGKPAKAAAHYDAVAAALDEPLPPETKPDVQAIQDRRQQAQLAHEEAAKWWKKAGQ